MKPFLLFKVLFKALCYNTLVKFFFLGNADFFKFKNASELTRKSLLIRVLYREQIMRHG